MPRPQTDLVAMIRQASDYRTIYGGRGLRGELYDLQALCFLNLSIYDLKTKFY